MIKRDQVKSGVWVRHHSHNEKWQIDHINGKLTQPSICKVHLINDRGHDKMITLGALLQLYEATTTSRVA